MVVHKYLRPYQLALLIACSLYVAACALPVAEEWRPTNMAGGGGMHYVVFNGAGCLILGWMFVLHPDSFGSLAWTANPLALIATVLLCVRRPAGAAAFGAACVALAALYQIDPPEGSTGHPQLPRVGSVLWLGSFLALTVAALIRRRVPLVAKQAEPGAAADGGGM